MESPLKTDRYKVHQRQTDGRSTKDRRWKVHWMHKGTHLLSLTSSIHLLQMHSISMTISTKMMSNTCYATCMQFYRNSQCQNTWSRQELQCTPLSSSESHSKRMALSYWVEGHISRRIQSQYLWNSEKCRVKKCLRILILSRVANSQLIALHFKWKIISCFACTVSNIPCTLFWLLLGLSIPIKYIGKCRYYCLNCTNNVFSGGFGQQSNKNSNVILLLGSIQFNSTFQITNLINSLKHSPKESAKHQSHSTWPACREIWLEVIRVQQFKSKHFISPIRWLLFSPMPLRMTVWEQSVHSLSTLPTTIP